MMGIELLTQFGRGKTPVIRQNEMAECGLACLAMVAGYYGFETSLSALRRRCNTTLRGMTLAHMVRVAEMLHMDGRALKVPMEALPQARLPAVIHWEMSHFVVLVAVNRRGYLIHDPRSGARTVTTEDFSKKYTGILLELTPTSNFTKGSEKEKLSLRELVGRISGLKRGFGQLLTLSLFMQVYILASPFFLQLVVDEVLVKSKLDLLYSIALGFGGFAVFYAIAQALRNYVVLYIGGLLSFHVASRLLTHLLKLPVSYFEKHAIGDVVSRFKSIDPLKRLLTEGLVGSFLDGAMALTTAIVMIFYSPLLAFISFTSWMLYFAVRMVLFGHLRHMEEEALRASADENTIFMETVNRIVSIKLFSGENIRKRLWQSRFAGSVHHNVRAQKYRAAFDAAAAGLQGLELVILVSVAAGMVLNAEFTVGMLFAFMAYRTSFSTTLTSLIERVVEFRMLGLHLERMADIVQTAPEKETGNNTASIEPVPVKGQLVLRDLTYRYSQNEPKILDGISLTINPGEAVAIIGETGCGKSTLLKILATLFEPNSGEILVDGRPLEHIGVAQYRQSIGVVMQDDGLLSGTIADNITFFDPEPDHKRLMEVAMAAAIIEDIIKMPMQMETLIGDMGAGLSGGQRQRIALARALYRRPQILLMDEGTSHLDVHTESRVNEALSKLNITRIIVAHRPETIRRADRILELSEGHLLDVTTDYFSSDIVRNSNQHHSFAPDQARFAQSGAEAGT